MKYLLLPFIILTSLGLQKTSSVKQFHWLEGNWKLEGNDAYEKWQMVDDTMIAALAYHFVEEHEEGERELVLKETIRFVSRGKKYYYIPIVRNQNKGKEVEFEITSFTKNSFVAENPNHDFPQRIVYKLEDEKHLHIYIEGNSKGKNKRVNYHFVKIE